MKTQSLIFEYILIILLSISIISYTYLWFKNNKFQIEILFSKEKLENKIKMLDIFVYNLIAFKSAKENFELETNGFCIGNYTVLQTGFRCTPTTLNISFAGYIIKYNNSLYVYSNKTKIYYSMIPYGYFIFRSCYEGFLSYIINSTECKVFCKYNCKLTILKNDSKIIIK